ncbi:MAG: hypothetical protein EAZ62_01850 [Sphingobacteriia bacterium]|nr:MAG: hypothetical protein EAZ62_01850 [Sphingobacteriia bacterium]
MRDQNKLDAWEQWLQGEADKVRLFPADNRWEDIRTRLHGNPRWPALTLVSIVVIFGLTLSTLMLAPTAKLLEYQAAQAELPLPQAAVDPVVAEQKNKAFFDAMAPSQVNAETFGVLREKAEQAQAVETYTASNWGPLPEQGNTVKSAPTIPAFETSANTTAQPVLDNSPVMALEKSNGLQKEATAQLKLPEQEMQLLQEDLRQQLGIYHKKPKANNTHKWQFQFYITPSKSYRTLSDAPVKDLVQPSQLAANTGAAVPLGLSYSAGVNDIVRHRPAMGFEFGFAALYPLRKNLFLKTGLQLNIRQYQIETFQTLTNAPTTISLIGGNGQVQNLSFLSGYNNNTGDRSAQLDNKTYQIAIPLGLEWHFFQGKHWGLQAEASVQPTYAVNANTYLLSTDFKNYLSDGGRFTRRWNINTSAAISVSFKSGQNQWQIGPQVRYQHLPSFGNQYPIREHLMDYGIRLAFTRQR